jgi:predicted MFS family arabinose efflux permease
MIIGRLIQGAGAVSSTISALASDLIKEEKRSKAMALIGGSIAIGFSISMVSSPILSGIYGIESLFLLAFIFGFISLLIISFKVQNPPVIEHQYSSKPDLKNILTNKSLIIMNITNFLQKGFMTFTFVLIPTIMIKTFHWETSELYMIYLPATILGIIAMAPASILAEKKRKPKVPLFAGIVFFLITLLLFNTQSQTLFIAGVMMFFIGFNIHEPIMQSLTSKLSKVHQKGLSLGIFNTFGYLGTFIGAFIGANILKTNSMDTFVLIFSVICIIWLLLIFIMKNPAHSKNIYINIDKIRNKPRNTLLDIKGIQEWYINKNENLLIIKFDSKITDSETIIKVL